MLLGQYRAEWSAAACWLAAGRFARSVVSSMRRARRSSRMAFLLNCSHIFTALPRKNHLPLRAPHRARAHFVPGNDQDQTWRTQRSAKTTLKRCRAPRPPAHSSDHAAASSHAAALALIAPFVAAETTTEWLRSEAGSDWQSITTDLFVRQLADGRVECDFAAHSPDHKFVDAFMVLLASMVAHAPTLGPCTRC